MEIQARLNQKQLNVLLQIANKLGLPAATTKIIHLLCIKCRELVCKKHL
jgi:hypothetical protein